MIKRRKRLKHEERILRERALLSKFIRLRQYSITPLRIYALYLVYNFFTKRKSNEELTQGMLITKEEYNEAQKRFDYYSDKLNYLYESLSDSSKGSLNIEELNRPENVRSKRYRKFC